MSVSKANRHVQSKDSYSDEVPPTSLREFYLPPY
jgi:hypothetical protein